MLPANELALWGYISAGLFLLAAELRQVALLARGLPMAREFPIQPAEVLLELGISLGLFLPILLPPPIPFTGIRLVLWSAGYLAALGPCPLLLEEGSPSKISCMYDPILVFVPQKT